MTHESLTNLYTLCTIISLLTKQKGEFGRVVKALCLGGLIAIITISAVRNGEGSNPSALNFLFAFFFYLQFPT